MKNILFSTFDMEVGGVERSLINLLKNFDYDKYQADLLLYSHTGEFMDELPEEPSLLPEVDKYKTFRQPIKEIFKSGHVALGCTRLFAKVKAGRSNSVETGYKQMQYMWKYALPFLPSINKEYDIAVSYLWPHYLVAEKVKAKTKIAWIHTDYSTVHTDIQTDLLMWNKFDYIAAVSEDCKISFLSKYPELESKVIVIENITSPHFVRELAASPVKNPMAEDSRFKIITVARLSHAKGIDNAVRALRLLKDKGYEDIAWYVVGYGGDEALIKSLIEKYDLNASFTLLGKQTNPYPFINEADLYVQPSRYEGKAVTVGEAQILGKPVLVTNYPTAASQVRNNYDGLICELSVEGIADGIERLYKDRKLREAIAANSNNTDYSNIDELNKLYRLEREENITKFTKSTVLF